MSSAADKLLTVAHVAARCHVSQRTVWRDIASGVLPVVRLGARAVRVRVADALDYRRAPLLEDRITAAVAARLCGVTERTIRNWIAQGYLPVCLVSPRRLYLSKGDLMARFHRGLLPRVPRSPRSSPEASSRPLLTIEDVARLTGRSKRSVWHDVEKGALPVRRFAGYVRVDADEAADYLGLDQDSDDR